MSSHPVVTNPQRLPIFDRSRLRKPPPVSRKSYTRNSDRLLLDNLNKSVTIELLSGETLQGNLAGVFMYALELAEVERNGSVSHLWLPKHALKMMCISRATR